VAAILGDPETDPHGHVIPPKHEAGAFRDEVPLERWHLHKPAVIRSVSDRSAAALRELERLGLLPGVRVTVEQRNSAAALSVRVGDRREPVRLNNELARCIRVSSART
jgi:Fe2+ transport system protein FeoA